MRVLLVLLAACGTPRAAEPPTPDPAATEACRASLLHTAAVVDALPERVREADPAELVAARERAEASVATCADVDRTRWSQAVQLRDGLRTAELAIGR